MIAIQKKGRSPFLIGVLVLVLVGAISLTRQRIQTEEYTANDFIFASDIGMSNVTVLGRTKTDVVWNAIKRAPQIIAFKLMGSQRQVDVERIDIDIGFSEYQKILEDRQRALKNGLLRNSHKVKAKIRYNEKQYKADVRLKGDLSNHWRSQMRMSFRVELKTKGTVLTFRKFSLHKPASRQYPYDQVYQSFVREAGGLSAVHSFVRVYVNGENWGIMNIEEHMSKELLEKQRKKESLIFKLGNEDSWDYRNQEENVYDNYRLSESNLVTSAYSSKKYLKNAYYRALYSYVDAANEARNIQLFDLESYLRAYLTTWVWHNAHTLDNSNSRHYLNPYTLRLEIITTDQGHLEEATRVSRFFPYDTIKGGFTSLYPHFQNHPDLDDRLPVIFDEVQSASHTIDRTYSEFSKYFPLDPKIDFTIVEPNLQFISKMIGSIDALPEQAQVPMITLNDQIIMPNVAQVAALRDLIYVKHFVDGRIRLYNLLPAPVTVMSIKVGETALQTPPIILPGYQELPFLEIRTDVKGIRDGDIRVQVYFQGQYREAHNNYSFVGRYFNPLDNSNNTKLPDFIEESAKASFRAKAGHWQVEGPLVIPGDLVVPPGTNFEFGSDAYLIIKGRLLANGDEKEPISFRPAGDTWKGIYVIEAKGRSSLDHVSVERTAALEAGLLQLTGGITFYKSDVDISNSSFVGAVAEDALNIVESDFSISKSTIQGAISDGLDSDFSTGRISNSQWRNIAGDAIDLSGSNVAIENVHVSAVGDKAISGGEQSNLVVKAGLLEDIGVGIASKDGSHIVANGISIRDYKLNALMAYVKKDYFGAPSLDVSQSDIADGSKWARQEGAELTIDGVNVEASELDIKELYNSDIMRK